MKLTKEQERIMNEAKRDIDFARTHTFIEWVKETMFPFESRNNMYDDNWYMQRVIEIEGDGNGRLHKWYEQEKDGRILTHGCNSRTLYKLEQFGLIKIETDGKDIKSKLDVIWVLNY